MNKLITSESVTEGHPDKMADQISDAILDEIIKKDPKCRAAIETLLTNGVCLIAGEVTTDAYVDMAGIARNTIKEIGYTKAEFGFHYETSGVMVAIKEQSSDIARGVDSYTSTLSGKIIKEDLKKLGAGDQGIVYGYACRETPELMPLPIVLSNKICQKLAEARKKNVIKGLRPDGKSQVTVSYENGIPKRIEAIIVAAQHNPDVKISDFRFKISDLVIKPVLKQYGYIIDKKTKILINTTGRFVIGGPQGDTGLTGRKNIVDTYGGVVPHGGGAFSGKDPTKVDRSGQYMARYVSKNIVHAGLADCVLTQIAYAIGKPEPIAVWVNTFGTEKIQEKEIYQFINRNFDLRPGMVIKTLDLRKPIYRQIASYGHFGRLELDLPWEKVDVAEKLGNF
ncbi:MAG: hypothetical protein ACD_58C00133G0002 [uncultured bacterium]|nr:MAG: hypothetical protein ACD_58C00133G0002 [uncultured bacterium]